MQNYGKTWKLGFLARKIVSLVMTFVSLFFLPFAFNSATASWNLPQSAPPLGRLVAPAINVGGILSDGPLQKKIGSLGIGGNFRINGRSNLGGKVGIGAFFEVNSRMPGQNDDGVVLDVVGTLRGSSFCLRDPLTGDSGICPSFFGSQAGVEGPKGQKGDEGKLGQAGSTSTIVGPVGLVGSTGSDGPRGSAGSIGLVGFLGKIGPRGVDVIDTSGQFVQKLYAGMGIVFKSYTGRIIPASDGIGINSFDGGVIVRKFTTNTCVASYINSIDPNGAVVCTALGGSAIQNTGLIDINVGDRYPNPSSIFLNKSLDRSSNKYLVDMSVDGTAIQGTVVRGCPDGQAIGRIMGQNFTPGRPPYQDVEIECTPATRIGYCGIEGTTFFCVDGGGVRTSITMNTTPPSPTTPPTTVAGDGQILITSWPAVSGAAKYKLYWNVDNYTTPIIDNITTIPTTANPLIISGSNTSSSIFDRIKFRALGVVISGFNSSATYTFKVSAVNSAGVEGPKSSAGTAVTARPPLVSVPIVDIKVNGSDFTDPVVVGSNVNISWTSTGATSCIASGSVVAGSDWSGSKDTSGSQMVRINESQGFNLTCTGIGGRSSDSVTVNTGASSAWKLVTVPNYYWYSIAFGNGKFVAVGYKPGGPPQIGVTMTSTDGANWVVKEVTSGDGWYSVTFGNGKFVAVGTYGSSMTSADGVNWTRSNRTAVQYDDWVGVGYGAGQFVGVGPMKFVASLECPNREGTIKTSTDGITWKFSKGINRGPGSRSIAYGSGKFVAVGPLDAGAMGNKVAGDLPGPVQTSPDGITWTHRDAPIDKGANTANNYTSVTYADNQFVAVGGGAAIMTSSDGITWTRRATPTLPIASFSGLYPTLWGVAYGNGKLVTVGLLDTSMVSTDGGATWTVLPFQPARSSRLWYGVAYGNNKFVAISNGNGVVAWLDGSSIATKPGYTPTPAPTPTPTPTPAPPLLLDTTIPAPSIISVTVESKKLRVDWKWTDSNGNALSGADGYYVYRDTNIPGSVSFTPTRANRVSSFMGGSLSPSYLDNNNNVPPGLTTGRSYCYRVSVFVDKGNGQIGESNASPGRCAIAN